MPVIPELSRQDVSNFKTSLGYLVKPYLIKTLSEAKGRGRWIWFQKTALAKLLILLLKFNPSQQCKSPYPNKMNGSWENQLFCEGWQMTRAHFGHFAH
jgi:hypothetical protein